MSKTFKQYVNEAKNREQIDEAKLLPSIALAASMAFSQNADAAQKNKTHTPTTQTQTTKKAVSSGMDKVTDKVLDYIGYQESNNTSGIVVWDRDAFAYGPFQIRKSYLTDVNNISKTKFTFDDVRHNYEKAKEAVKIYLNHYVKNAESKLGRPLSLREILAIHNGGPAGYTKSYNLKYADEVIAKMNAGYKIEKKTSTRDDRIKKNKKNKKMK